MPSIANNTFAIKCVLVIKCSFGNGFTGIAIARCSYLTGCDHIEIKSQELHDGKTIEGHWFDEPRVELLESDAVALNVIGMRDAQPSQPDKEVPIKCSYRHCRGGVDCCLTHTRNLLQKTIGSCSSPNCLKTHDCCVYQFRNPPQGGSVGGPGDHPGVASDTPSAGKLG